MSEPNPFQPGTRVAIVDYGRWGGHNTYRETRVLKAYKSGRFTLETDPKQQWSPWLDRGFSEPRWTAYAAGRNRYSAGRLHVWDASMDNEVAEAAAARDREARWSQIQEQIERIRRGDATDALIGAVEAAIHAFDRAGKELDPSPSTRSPAPLPVDERAGE